MLHRRNAITTDNDAVHKISNETNSTGSQGNHKLTISYEKALRITYGH